MDLVSVSLPTAPLYTPLPPTKSMYLVFNWELQLYFTLIELFFQKKIILNFQKICKNNRELLYTFTQIYQFLTFCHIYFTNLLFYFSILCVSFPLHNTHIILSWTIWD